MKRTSELALKEMSSSIFDELTFEQRFEEDELKDSKNELIKLKQAFDFSDKRKEFNTLLNKDTLSEKVMHKMRSQSKISSNQQDIVNLKNIIKHEQQEYKERLESNRS